MEKGGINYKMEAIFKDNGPKIKLMVLELYFLKTVNLSIKGNGEMIYIMVGVLFTRKLETGTNIKDSLKMVSNKEEAEFSSETVQCMMANLKMIRFQEEEEK
jgi:hypothetical protein